MIGNLQFNGSIEVSTRFNHKVVLLESQNEHKDELSDTTRKVRGGKRGGRGKGRSSGNTHYYHHHNHTANSASATTVSARTHFGVSTFFLCMSFWL